MSYAIISLGGKQYRVREGERLLVDRVAADEGSTFEPRVLLVGGDGTTDLSPSATVTARIVGHELGTKIRIGKYRRRTGYRRHGGYRSRLTRIEIESIGSGGRTSAAAKATPTKAAAKADAVPAGDAGTALPEGYAKLTVVQVSEAVAGWSREQVEAAVEYERSHQARKGALAALETAAGKEE